MNLYITYYTKSDGDSDAEVYVAPDDSQDHAYAMLAEMWSMTNAEARESFDNLTVYPLAKVDGPNGKPYTVTLEEA